MKSTRTKTISLRIALPVLLGVVMLAGSASAASIYVVTWEDGPAGAALGSELFLVDSGSGNATSIGFVGTRLSGLTFANSTLYGWGQNGSLYTVSTSTGLGTLVGASGVSGTEGAMAYNPADGMLYAADSSGAGNQLVKIAPGTGVGTVVGPFGAAGGDMSGLAFAGSTLYGLDAFADNLVTVNTTTGLATVVGALGVDVGGGGGASVGGFTYDGLTAYMVNTAGVYSVDLTSGVATNLSTLSANLLGRPIGGAAITPIPEAGTLALLGLGLSGLALVARRRRRT